MIDQRYTLTTDASPQIEATLSRFDRQRALGPVECLADYAPDPDDPAYPAVVTEIARVDLEHQFEESGSGSASVYINSFPDVFADDHYRTQIAYEEYRLRRRFNDNVETVAFGSRYGVDASRWAELPLGESDANNETGKRPSSLYTPHASFADSIKYPIVGDHFAGYELIAQLGEGAYSRVFLARQDELARRFVVLKVTPLDAEESDKLARLQHSHIIPIYSVHRQDNLSAICMPFLGATTLADFSALSERWMSLDGPAQELVSTVRARQKSTIQLVASSTASDGKTRERKLESHEMPGQPSSNVSQPNEPSFTGLERLSSFGYVDALVELVFGAVEGVAHAHRRGIVHRDLKPANVLVTDEGSPVVLDFNLAMTTEELDVRVVGGTLPYMSPQQLESLRTGASSQTSDDVFGLGVILYELLTGRLPFASPENHDSFDLDALVHQRRQMPQSLRSINSRISPGLESIVMRCIASDHAERYADASQLLEDLRLHRENRPLKFAADRSITERVAKWSRRHPMLASGTTVSTVAAIALLTIATLWWQGRVQNARLGAEAKLQEFNSLLPSAIMALSTPGKEPELLSDGLRQSRELLESWHISDEQWQQASGASLLAAEEQSYLARSMAELLEFNAAAEDALAKQSGDDEASRQKHESAALRMHEQVRKFESNSDALVSWVPMLESLNPSRSLIREKLQRQPTNVTRWFQLATNQMQGGELESAIASFDFCDQMLPNTVPTIFNRGVCRLWLNQHAEAVADFSHCLELRPSLVIARFNRAAALHELGEHQAAIKDLDTVISAGDPKLRMLLFRAEVHERVGNADLARVDRDAALKIAPRDINDYLARGYLRLKESPSKALADFQAAERIDANNPSALQNLANVYAERLGDAPKSIAYLDRLISLRPGEAVPLASRGILKARLKDFQAAIADAEAAAAMSLSGREKLQIAGVYAMASAHDSGEQPLASGDKGKLRSLAIKWLARALKAEPALAGLAKVDPDLYAIKDDPQFRRLVDWSQLLDRSAQ